MCGRFGMGLDRDELRRRLPGVAVPDDIAPRWNVAPTQPVLVLRARDGARRGERVRWGIEIVTPEGRARTLINVRSESLREWGQGDRERVLVPATHFFEWQRRRPMRIAPRGGMMAFAGLLSPTSEVAIVTCPANRTLAAIHDRMPVVVPPEAWERWLDARLPPAAVADLLGPCPDEALTVTPASRLVNDAGNDSPAVLAPGPAEPEQAELPF